MNPEKLWPEHMCAGFLHVLWIGLAILLLLGADPKQVWQSLFTISSGGAVLIGSVVVGASFFVGALFDRLLSDFSSLFGPRQTAAELRTAFKKNPESVKELHSWWASKCLFRSAMCAFIPLIVCALLWDARTNGGKPVVRLLLWAGCLKY
jgi:hypothetical protein